MPGATQPTILLIENDEDTRRIYTDVLAQTGAYLLEAGNPYEGFNALRTHPISLILTDLHMPGGGIECLATLRRETAACPIVVITGVGGGIRSGRPPYSPGQRYSLKSPFGRSSSERL